MTPLNLQKNDVKKTSKVSKISCYLFWSSSSSAVAAVLIPVLETGLFFVNRLLKKSASTRSPPPPAPCLLGSWGKKTRNIL